MLIDHHAPQRMRNERQNNLPVPPSQPPSRHLLSTFQGSGARVFQELVINYMEGCTLLALREGPQSYPTPSLMTRPLS